MPKKLNFIIDVCLVLLLLCSVFLVWTNRPKQLSLPPGQKVVQVPPPLVQDDNATAAKKAANPTP